MSPARISTVATASETRSQRVITALVVVFLTIIALGVRLSVLGARSFDNDEATSVAFAALDWPTFRHVVTTFEADMSLYYATLRLWLHLGSDEATVRFLSVVPALATVPAVYAIGARWFGARTGLVAALLLTLNGLHVVWSQTARAYTLVTLLATLSTYFFLRSVEAPSTRRWTLYVATSVLAIYAHFFVALVIFSHWVSVIVMRRTSVPWRGLVLSVAAIAVGWMPVALFVLTRDVGQIDVQVEPTLRQVVGLFNGLAGGYGYRLPLILYSVATAAALITGWRAWRRGPGSVEAWRYVVLTLWLCLPILIAIGVSQVKPVFAVRYFVLCIPAFTLLAAIGIGQVRRRALFWAFLAAAVIIGAVSVRDNLRAEVVKGAGATEQWKEATAYILSRAAPGDALVFYVPKMRVGFEYYRGQSGSSAATPVVVFPEPWRWEFVSAERLQTPPPGLIERLSEQYPRVWLILSHIHFAGPGRSAMSETIQASLARQYPVAEKQEFMGVTVVRYSGR